MTGFPSTPRTPRSDPRSRRLASQLAVTPEFGRHHAIAGGTIYVGQGSVGLGQGVLEKTADASLYNVAIGFEACQAITTGSYNVGLGWHALNAATTGYQNTAVGAAAGKVLTIGAGNTLVGTSAGVKLTVGSANSALGANALNDCVVGVNNVAIGWNAGRSCLGDGNVFIGASAGSLETGSNKLYIGSLIYGEFDTGMARVNGDLHATGDLRLASSSVQYFGDPAANGSWRAGISGDDLVFERREFGNWETKLTIPAW